MYMSLIKLQPISFHMILEQMDNIIVDDFFWESLFQVIMEIPGREDWVNAIANALFWLCFQHKGKKEPKWLFSDSAYSCSLEARSLIDIPFLGVIGSSRANSNKLVQK